MRIVNVAQNGKEWIAWRGKGIGASDAPSVMGLSKWTSAFELWSYVTGLCVRPEANVFAAAAMKRGQDLEPLARELANKQLGKTFIPLCLEMKDKPFIRASLDGFCGNIVVVVAECAQEVAVGGEILEIKCPGKEAHAKALKGKVPEEYMVQVQQQLMVARASRAYYFSWDGKSAEGVVIEVLPDLAYHTKLEAALTDFWNRVQLQMPPDATKADLDKFATRLLADVKRLNNTVSALELLAGALP